MKFGLEPEDVEKIEAVIASFPEVGRAIIYGSRAKCTYRAGSDIDLCLVGGGLNLSIANAISQRIDELNLPYLFDIAIYHQISNADLLEHINRVGISLYERT